MQEQTIIAIVNEKGGTGKTTTAVSLSAALGEMGKRVLLVDLDGQAASSRWLGVEEDPRLAEALLRGGGLEPISDLLPGVSLAPASGKLDSVSHDLRPTQGGRLRKVLAEMTDYDFILIDCPPSLGNRLIGNALLAATHVIVPVETSILALDGLKILLTTLEDIRDGFEHDLILGGVLACRYDARTRLSRLVLTELRRALPGKVFETVIRENVRMRECPASGQSIMGFAPDSHAAEDYRALATEMLAYPERWCEPVAATQTADGQEDQYERVDDLRARASAQVREFARRDAARFAAADAEEGSAAAADAAAVEERPVAQWNLTPLKSEADSSVPAQPGAEGASPGLTEPTRLADLRVQYDSFESWVSRLGKAKERLETECSRDEMEGSVYFEDSPCPSIVAAVESPSSEPPAEAAPAEAVSEAPVSPDLSAENSAVAPGEAAPSPATSTPPNAGEEGDYPALREALRKIAAKDGKAGKAEKGSDQGNRPAWRKLLRIGSGAK